MTMKKYLLGSLLLIPFLNLQTSLSAYILETGDPVDLKAGNYDAASESLPENAVLTLNEFDNYAFRPYVARRRAAIRREIRRHCESGFEIEYVNSRLKTQTDNFTGNLLLFGLERRFSFPWRSFYVGGKAVGGMYLTAQGVEGGLGYGGFMTGLEFGRRPLRMAMGYLFGAGGAGISETLQVDSREETHTLNCGFLVLEPEIAFLLSTSPFSSMELGFSYLYIPVGNERNLGGTAVSLSFLFSW